MRDIRYTQVSIIASTAERQAATGFAKAAAMRPKVVGAGLKEITSDPLIAKAMFDILEAQRVIAPCAKTNCYPKG